MSRHLRTDGRSEAPPAKAGSLARPGSPSARSGQDVASEEERIRGELHRILIQVPAAVCITRGPTHVIESANLLYQQMTGGRDLVGRTAREAFPELATQGFFELLDQVFMTGEPHTGTEGRVVWDRTGDGSLQEGFVNHAYQPLTDQNGVVYGILLHVVDVTELVRSRRLVEGHAEDLTRATQSLTRINRELDQFAYVASHDLKAPLRGIASLAQWIEDDLGERLSTENRKHLALLRSRIERMDALIDGLLQYSRAGRVRNRVETVDVRQLSSDVIDMLHPPAEAVIDIAGGLPVFETEKLPLQQVLLNLVSNSIKHSGRPDTCVRIAARDNGEFFEFTVQDNGAGIPRQFQNRVWEIFQTLQPRDKVEGAGIGLALVKKNVEARGGRAWLESRESQGTTVHFLWPKRIEEEE
jgi:signal transduction histidine kinase